MGTITFGEEMVKHSAISHRNTEVQIEKYRTKVERREGMTITFLSEKDSTPHPQQLSLRYFTCTHNTFYLATMYEHHRKLSAGEWQKLKNASQVISKQFRTKNSATEHPNISWYILDGDLLVSIAMLQFDLNTRKKFTNLKNA